MHAFVTLHSFLAFCLRLSCQLQKMFLVNVWIWLSKASCSAKTYLYLLQIPLCTGTDTRAFNPKKIIQSNPQILLTGSQSPSVFWFLESLALFIHATNQTLEVRTPTFQNQFLILSVAKGSGLQYLSHSTTSFACWTPRHEDDTSKSLCIKHIQWSHKMKLSARIYIQVSTLLMSLILLEKDSFQFIDFHLDSLIYVINLSSL